MVDFVTILKENQINLVRGTTGILQINIGKKCNQACAHCHVNAGPNRTEQMDKKTVDRIIMLLKNSRHIHTVDITGGAPELNANFKYLIGNISGLGLKIIDRCNLTVLFEKGQEDTAEFLAKHKVEIFASLPCYTQDNVNYQRGDNVYSKSISALKMLNDLGYGKSDNELIINLVYNPLGDYLPGKQSALESDYKQALFNSYGIVFNKLITITNMPIARFKDKLVKEGKLEGYINLLCSSFSTKAAESVMCKNLISVGYDGKLYDCDFNQAINLPIAGGKNIWDIDSFDLLDKNIVFGNHCYACTASFGSSCTGQIA